MIDHFTRISAQCADAQMNHAGRVDAGKINVVVTADVNVHSVGVEQFEQGRVIEYFVLALLRQRPHWQVRKHQGYFGSRSVGL